MEIEVPQAPVSEAPAPEVATTEEIHDHEKDSRDLERHFDALTNLERYFPQMVKLAARMAEMLGQMGNQRHFDPTKTKFGAVKWYAENQGGHVVFEVIPMGDKTPGFGKNTKFPTFAKLKAIDQKFPQIVGVCFAIASQLAKYVNTNRIYNHEIQFKGPVFFEGPDDHGQSVAKMRFQVFHGNTLIGPTAIGKVAI